jgi:isoleucyl-tRNA synthetase
VLDTVVTAELEAEGLARDVIRVVQQARRAADLDVSDRIRLEIVAPDGVVAAVETHADFVRGETLATELAITPGSGAADGFEGEVGDGQKVAVVVRRTV